MNHTTSKGLVLLLVVSSLLISSVSAFFPNSTADSEVNEPIYSIDIYMIPWQLWLFFAAVGLIFLTLSVCVPERGELVTGTLALMFNTVVWLTSSFIGFWEVQSGILETHLVTQPVVVLLQPVGIPYLLLGVFLVTVFNWVLGVFNFLTKPAKVPKSVLE